MMIFHFRFLPPFPSLQVVRRRKPNYDCLRLIMINTTPPASDNPPTMVESGMVSQVSALASKEPIPIICSHEMYGDTLID
ncbi:hypothetical protein JW960_16835 [candidate division KSB1 bacterium]|nr:hypothetical protein [candidate division KSB1 bacterium]